MHNTRMTFTLNFSVFLILVVLNFQVLNFQGINPPPQRVFIPTDVTGLPFRPPDSDESGDQGESFIRGTSQNRTIYDGCDTLKYCLAPIGYGEGAAPDPECKKPDSRNCKMLITFGDNPQVGESIDDENEIIIEMQREGFEKWIAMGLQENPKDDNSNLEPRMPLSYCIECVSEDNAHRVNIYHSWNDYSKKAKKDNFRIRNGTVKQVIRPFRAFHSGSHIYCRFAMKKNYRIVLPRGRQNDQHHEEVEINLRKTEYFILFAWGRESFEQGEDGYLKEHGAGNCGRSRLKHSLLKRLTPLPKQRVHLGLHTAFSTIALLFFIPIGHVSARYFKETFVGKKVFQRYPIWLVVHVSTMTIALILFSISLFYQYKANEGWTNKSPSAFHGYGGCFGIGFSLAVFVLGFFLEPSKFGSIDILGRIHAVFGVLSYIISVIVAETAVKIQFSGLACYVPWLFLAFTIFYLGIHGSFTAHYCWVDWVLGLKNRRALSIFPISQIYVQKEASDQVATSQEKIITLSKITQDPRQRGVAINLYPAPGENPHEAPGVFVRCCLMLTLIAGLIFFSSFMIYEVVHNHDGHEDCYDSLKTLELVYENSMGK